LQKAFLGGDRKFSGPLMRFARGEMRDHIVCTKTTRELRIGVTEYCSGHVGQKSTFARLLTSFDFRLLQQYPRGERTSSGCLGMSEVQQNSDILVVLFDEFVGSTA
jgi:hypothetical protein